MTMSRADLDKQLGIVSKEKNPAATESKTQGDDFGLKKVELPFIPLQVKYSDLQNNGTLLTDKEFEQIKNFEPGKHKKTTKDKEGVGKYSVLIIEEKEEKTPNKKTYFAIYPGKIGEGGLGKVRIAQNLETKEWVAIKLENATGSRNPNILKNEIFFLKKLGHQPQQLLRKKINKKSKEEYQQNITTMKLYPGTDLTDFYEGTQFQGRSSYQELEISLGQLKAIQTLHKNNILHCDIKPSNFMYDKSTGKVEVVDVGLSCNKGDKISRRGTKRYYSPELINAFFKKKLDTITYTEQDDIYSLGLSIAIGLNYYKIITEDLFIISSSEQSKESKRIEVTERYRNNNPDMYYHLKKMTETNPTKREKIEDSIEFFEKEIKKYSENFFFVDLKEYENDLLNNRETLLLSILTNLEAHRVIFFINEKEYDLDKTKKIVEYLKRESITPTAIYTHSDSCKDKLEIIQKIAAFYKKKGQNQNHFFVTDTKNATYNDMNYYKIKIINSDEIYPAYYIVAKYFSSEIKFKKHLKEIQKSLSDDILRLKGKYKDKDGKITNQIVNNRIAHIEAALEEIHKKSNSYSLNAESINKILTDLESKMLPTGLVSNKSIFFTSPERTHSFKTFKSLEINNNSPKESPPSGKNEVVPYERKRRGS